MITVLTLSWVGYLSPHLVLPVRFYLDPIWTMFYCHLWHTQIIFVLLYVSGKVCGPHLSLEKLPFVDDLCVPAVSLSPSSSYMILGFALLLKGAVWLFSGDES